MIFSWDIFFSIIGPLYLILITMAVVITLIELHKKVSENILMTGELEKEVTIALLNKKNHFNVWNDKRYIEISCVEGFVTRMKFNIMEYPKKKYLFDFSRWVIPYSVAQRHTSRNILVPRYFTDFIKKIETRKKRLTNPKKRIG